MLDGWTPESNKGGKDSKNGTKRPSDEAESPKPKRRKRASQPRKPAKREQSDGSEAEEKPTVKKVARRKSKPDESDKQINLKTSSVSNKKRTAETKDESKDEGKDRVKRDDSDKEESKDESKDTVKRDDSDKEDSKAIQSKTKVESDDAKKPSANEPAEAEEAGAEGPKVEEGDPAGQEEEEYSDVIDQVPQPKRKKKDKSKKEPSSKPAKSTSRKVSVSTPDDADEAEMKKLQSQLVKCGIRKLWHNELKKHGDDARAKIRHLKKMLAEVGMEGRFSEAKAREVKEARELMADAEAAREMNALWGMNSGGRASRSKNKPTKAEESGGSGADDKVPEKGAEDDDDDDDAGNAFAARRRRAQADLAFLGDDGDSD